MEQSRRRKPNIGKIILWAVLLAALACGVFFGMRALFEKLRGENEPEHVVQSADDLTESKVSAQDDPEPPFDFEPYRSINPDVCAWITIDGTDIDDPVLLCTGDAEYMTKNWKGEESENGSICLDVSCSPQFLSPVMFLYGQKPLDGSLLAGLYRFYEDRAFFDEEHPIRVTTLDGAVLTYRVIAAYEASYAHPLFYYDMFDEADFMAYCDSFLHTDDLRVKAKDVAITAEDQILTLVTHTNVREDERLFVQAVLADDE